MKKIVLLLTAVASLTIAAHAQLHLLREECDDFFVQDGSSYSRAQYKDYTVNGIKVTVAFLALTSEAIAWEPKARPITEKDVQNYAARNGVDLSNLSQSQKRTLGMQIL